jgi:hypothetical protein
MYVQSSCSHNKGLGQHATTRKSDQLKIMIHGSAAQNQEKYNLKKKKKKKEKKKISV